MIIRSPSLVQELSPIHTSSLTKAKLEAASPFEIETFHDEPGIYFENTSQLQ